MTISYLTTQFSVFWIPAVSVGKGENIMAVTSEHIPLRLVQGEI
jgi:hypothetical protein